jgi:hypothetical protein
VVSINEAIELAKNSEDQTPRFVNGILDRVKTICHDLREATTSSPPEKAWRRSDRLGNYDPSEMRYHFFISIH